MKFHVKKKTLKKLYFENYDSIVEHKGRYVCLGCRFKTHKRAAGFRRNSLFDGSM